MLRELLSPTLDYVEADGHVVVLRGKRKLPVGKEVSLRANMPGGGRSELFKILVDSCRPLTNGGFAVSGRITSGKGLPEAQSNFSDDALRSAPRIDCHICVLSKDLPGYRAVTVDFSSGGVQLEVPAEMEAGQTVLMRLEFDVSSVTPVECSARVAWCSMKERGRYRVGLQFVGLDQAARANIARYEEIMLNRDDTSILHRILFGNDYALPAEQAPAPEAPQAAAPRPDTRVPLGGRHNGRLLEYARHETGVIVKLARPDGSVGEYHFNSVRGLSDYLGSEPAETNIADIVVKSSAGNAKRFQLVDQMENVCLEVVATTCTFS
ncbi:MAG: PilZ domain-containing protein [Candidatus Eremiobacteraeota bacterium]|nr:PilZ domain-containing protein [Candidatus Eremiobacteraeota bacterium]